VYTVPYIVDVVGPVPGIRLHWPTVRASEKNVQMVIDAGNGLTLGGVPTTTQTTTTTTTTGGSGSGSGSGSISRRYALVHHDDRYEKDLSPLGLSLRWTTTAAASIDGDTGDGGADGPGDSSNSTTASDNGNTLATTGESTSTSVVEAALVRDDGAAKTKDSSENAGSARNSSDDDDDDDDSSSAMTTHLVRGMPYATMEYSGSGIVPAITSAKALASTPVVDGGKSTLRCGKMTDSSSGGGKGEGSTVVAEREVVLHFKGSDFTWAAFFSRPVTLSCQAVDVDESGPGVMYEKMFQMSAVPVVSSGEHHDDDDAPLVVRVALVNECTTGDSAIAAHCEPERAMADVDGYLDLLRRHVASYPRHPVVGIDYNTVASSSGDEKETNTSGDDDDDDASRVTFDWDVQTYSPTSSFNRSRHHRNLRTDRTASSNRTSSSQPSYNSADDSGDTDTLLMFAMPHHQEQLDGSQEQQILKDYCKPTFHGSACIVKGKKWALTEKLGAPQSFVGEYPPEAAAIPHLAEALATDIKYELSDNLHRGAADTYFSGKVLAKLGRIILVAAEMLQLSSDRKSRFPVLAEYAPSALKSDRYSDSVEAAKKASLPSEEDIAAAVEELKKGVEIWINGNAEALYVYDESWGGLVNCGCVYGTCVYLRVLCLNLRTFEDAFHILPHFSRALLCILRTCVSLYRWGRFQRLLQQHLSRLSGFNRR